MSPPEEVASMPARLVRVLACVVLLGLPACSSGTGPLGEPSTAPGSPTTALADLLVRAEEAGAGAAQLAVLRAATDTGMVPVGAVRAAARRAVACMRDSRLDARYEETVLEGDVVLPGWAVLHATDDDHADAQVEACDEREHLWISQAYQAQPVLAAEHRTVELSEPGA
jgi:hypothetical protein